MEECSGGHGDRKVPAQEPKGRMRAAGARASEHSHVHGHELVVRFLPAATNKLPQFPRVPRCHPRKESGRGRSSSHGSLNSGMSRPPSEVNRGLPGGTGTLEQVEISFQKLMYYVFSMNKISLTLYLLTTLYSKVQDCVTHV